MKMEMLSSSLENLISVTNNMEPGVIINFDIIIAFVVFRLGITFRNRQLWPICKKRFQLFAFVQQLFHLIIKHSCFRYLNESMQVHFDEMQTWIFESTVPPFSRCFLKRQRKIDSQKRICNGVAATHLNVRFARVYVLMRIPDTLIVEGKAVRFFSVNIDPVPSLKQACIMFRKISYIHTNKNWFLDFNLLLRS